MSLVARARAAVFSVAISYASFLVSVRAADPGVGPIIFIGGYIDPDYITSEYI